MNGALADMLHCLHTPENFTGNSVELSVLERQRARVKWQQQQLQSQQSYLDQTQYNAFSLSPQGTQTQFCQTLVNNGCAIRELANRSMKADPGLETGLPNFGNYQTPKAEFVNETTRFSSSGFATTSVEMGHSVSRTSSCPPTMATEEKGRDSVLTEKMASTVGRENVKKRKSDKAQNPKIDSAEHTRDKRIKGDAQEVESKVTDQNNNRETSAETSKENSKTSEVQKPDYIHVRARRGQATDSHSLAERVRREKISERMKHLQDLVPGCNKITGKAGMLDEIINYVQSLQRQVEFLSMKLAVVNPRLDVDIDNFFTKEMLPACTSTSFLPGVGMSSEMANPAYLQFNPAQEVVSCCGLDMAINPPDMGLGRTTSPPVTIPETFLDTSCFTQSQPSSTWEADLPSLFNMDFHQGRSTAFLSQPFTGNVEANNLKLEM